MSTNKYFTDIELSKRWGEKISVQTIRNWRTAKVNKGPAFVKFGGRVLYPADGVEDYEKRAFRDTEVA